MMVPAMVFGACAAVVLFAARLFLPAKIGARYDRVVLTGFRWIGLAGLATVAGIGIYAAMIAR